MSFPLTRWQRFRRLFTWHYIRQTKPVLPVYEWLSRPRVYALRLRLWRRLVMRLLGVPFHVQDVFLDPRRWSVAVSSHAIEQAGERYREGNPQVIALEVLDALVHGRKGDRTPNNRHGAKRFSWLVWSADQRKVYVVKGRRRCQVVVTALPTDWSLAMVESRERRTAARVAEPTRIALAFQEAGYGGTASAADDLGSSPKNTSGGAAAGDTTE